MTGGLPIPEAFVDRMRGLLGDEAEEFLSCFERERCHGLRLNPLKYNAGDKGRAGCDGPLKTSLEETRGTGLKETRTEKTDVEKVRLEIIPWAEGGYYYKKELEPGKHPLHEAGLYYIQEPSAMAAVEALAPLPGEKILDLCAAPGGKSTQAAGKMAGQGLIVCNEINPQRARTLSQNIERMGIANAVVTNMPPEGLASRFVDFFDGVIVDAPCSGEGMFRKDPEAMGQWSPRAVSACAERQAGILDCAARMVRPGGRMVYSTCTFSPEENEQVILGFLETHPDFSLKLPDCAGFFSPGRPEWANGLRAASACADSDETAKSVLIDELAKTVRIWPHKVAGEGHFIALLIRQDVGGQACGGRERTFLPETGDAASNNPAKGIHGKVRNTGRKIPGKDRDTGKIFSRRETFLSFCDENLTDWRRVAQWRVPLIFGGELYMIPSLMPDLEGLKVLRPGLMVGVIKKDRVEPAHALAMFLRKDEAARRVEIGSGELSRRFLRGEELSIPEILMERETLRERKPEGCPQMPEHRKGRDKPGDSRTESHYGPEDTTGHDTGAGISGNGWTLITADGYPLGWAKKSGGTLKNHYPKGLRKNLAAMPDDRAGFL